MCAYGMLRNTSVYDHGSVRFNECISASRMFMHMTINQLTGKS